MSKKHGILNTRDLFKGEQGRGIVTSITGATIANGLNYYLQKGGMPIQSSSLLSLSIIGNILAYTLDIVFAKENFKMSEYNGKIDYFGKVPYSDLKTRCLWLFKSFGDKFFFRYLITVLIDSFIALTLLEYIINYLDENEIMKDNKIRDVLAAAFVAGITFFLYLNTLRFNWAYKEDEDPILNIIVLMWLTLLIAVYLGFKNNNYNSNILLGSKIKSKEEKTN